MQGLEQCSPGTPAGTTLVSTSRKRWQGTLRQLQVWSRMINYSQVPGNDRQQTKALIESIEYLVLRLASAVHVRQESPDLPDGPLRELLARIYETCIDSLQTISAALDEQRPVPDLPDMENTIHEAESRVAECRQSVARDADVHASCLRFMGTIVEMRSLAAAIQDCRDKANALDWVAWNRSYF
jgi:soluble cytochrome b562